MKGLALLLFVLMVAGTASAQDLNVAERAFLGNIDLPSFFICVVGGVLLAIGFQTVLTLISVASGITAVGDLEKKGHSTTNHSTSKSNSSDTPVAVKVTSAMGIWTMITVSVSLFFASWLAVNLSLINLNFIGLSLGLIIWAAFFTTMVYLEVKMVTSLLGGLMNLAFSGLRSGFSAVGGAFEKSRKDEMKEVAAYTVDHARQELAQMFDNGKVEKKISRWVKDLQPDYTRMRKELASLISDIEMREEENLGPHGITREMFLNVTGAMPSLSKRDKQKMGELFDDIKSAAKTKGGPVEKVMAGVDKLAPGSEEDTREFRQKVEQYLRQANRDEISPDKLKKDLSQILSHPSRAPQVIMNRLNQFDRNTLVAVLEQRSDISHQDAQKYAGHAEQALDSIRSTFSSTQDKFNSMGQGSTGSGDSKASSSNDWSDLRNAEIGVVHTDRGDRVQAYAPAVEPGYPYKKKVDKETTNRVEGQLRSFFEGMEGSEWDYDRLKHDFVQMFKDPAAAPNILQQRLREYDRDSMVVFMENTGFFNRQQAERVADKVTEAKEEVLHKADALETQARARVEEAKAIALHQAENTRRAAMAASWWLVATALVSGVAAAVGGMIAL